MAETVLSCYEQKRKNKAKWALFISVFACFGIIFMPVHAGAVADIVTSVLSWALSWFAQLIASFLQLFAYFLVNTMSISISDIKGLDMMIGFNNFGKMICLLATSFATIIVLWQLISIMISPLTGNQQTQSVGSIITRALIFIPLTFASENLAFIWFGEMQKIYQGLYDGAIKSQGFPDVCGSLNAGIMGAENTLTQGMGDGWDVGFIEVVTSLFCWLSVIFILFNVLKLILEMIQRFAVMFVYAYLSPLAMACGVGAGTLNITKKALTVYVSSSLLWILNVWSLSVIFSLLEGMDSMADSTTTFFLWVVITYGVVKVLQKLDDVFNTVGASNVSFTGSMLEDLLSVGSTFKALGGMAKGIGNVAKGGWGFAKKGVGFAKNGTSNFMKGASAKGAAYGAARDAAKGINGPKAPFKTANGAVPKSAANNIISKTRNMAMGTMLQTKEKISQGIANSKIGKGVSGTYGAVKSSYGKVRQGFNNMMSENNLFKQNKALNSVGLAGNPLSHDKGIVKGMSKSAFNNTFNNPGFIGAMGATLVASGAIPKSANVTGFTRSGAGDIKASYVSSANGKKTIGTSRSLNSDTTKPRTATVSSLGQAASPRSSVEVNGARVATVCGGTPCRDGSGLKTINFAGANGTNINAKVPENFTSAQAASVFAGTADEKTMNAFKKSGDMNQVQNFRNNFGITDDSNVAIHNGGLNPVGENGYADIHCFDKDTHASKKFAVESIAQSDTSRDFMITDMSTGETKSLETSFNTTAPQVAEMITGTNPALADVEFSENRASFEAAREFVGNDSADTSSVQIFENRPLNEDANASVYVGDTVLSRDPELTTESNDVWSVRTSSGEETGQCFIVDKGSSSGDVLNEYVTNINEEGGDLPDGDIVFSNKGPESSSDEGKSISFSDKFEKGDNFTVEDEKGNRQECKFEGQDDEGKFEYTLPDGDKVSFGEEMTPEEMQSSLAYELYKEEGETYQEFKTRFGFV